MAERIPDLWKIKEDATRLYSIYLARLRMNDRNERIVTACRQIRQYAARGPGTKEALFTFDDEIDALCDLQKYSLAWRQFQFRDKIVFGRRIDLASPRKRTAGEYLDLTSYYAPLLYFRERYRQGCSLLETALDVWFRRKNVQSYSLLFHIYNSDTEPSHRCRVTLSHFYTHLHKPLQEWRHWEAFVSGFHPKLFRLTGVRRDELLSDSARMARFFENLMAIRDERLTSGVGGSLGDLIDSPGKVKKRQEALQKRFAEFDRKNAARRESTDAKLRRLFPELRRLRR